MVSVLYGMASRPWFRFGLIGLKESTCPLAVVVPIKLHCQLRLITTVKPGLVTSLLLPPPSRKDASSTHPSLVFLASHRGLAFSKEKHGGNSLAAALIRFFVSRRKYHA